MTQGSTAGHHGCSVQQALAASARCPLLQDDAPTHVGARNELRQVRSACSQCLPCPGFHAAPLSALLTTHMASQARRAHATRSRPFAWQHTQHARMRLCVGADELPTRAIGAELLAPRTSAASGASSPACAQHQAHCALCAAKRAETMALELCWTLCPTKLPHQRMLLSRHRATSTAHESRMAVRRAAYTHLDPGLLHGRACGMRRCDCAVGQLRTAHAAEAQRHGLVAHAHDRARQMQLTGRLCRSPATVGFA